MIKLPRAEFFDIFGLGTFGVIVFVSARALFLGTSIPFWAVIFLFFVGVAGLIIDGTTVYRAYFRRNNNSGTQDSSVVR